MWDVNEGQAFWFNLQDKRATWTRPPLLSRYGDVSEPCPWVAVDVTMVERARRAGEKRQALVAEGPAAVAAAQVLLFACLEVPVSALYALISRHPNPLATPRRQDDRKRRRKKRAKLYRQRERLDQEEVDRLETERLEGEARKKKEEFERFMARQVRPI